MVECPECQGTGLEEFKPVTAEVKGLPVAGYKPTQSQAAVDLVSEGKILEERMMRYIDRVADFAAAHEGDPRFAAIGRTQVQLGMMAVFRAVFAPGRVELPEDIGETNAS